MTKSERRIVLLGLVVGLWVLSSACSCSDVLDKLGLGVPSPETETTTTVRATTKATTAPSATSRPTSTPASEAQGLSSIPTQSGAEFTVTLSEDEINAYVAGQDLSQQGVEVRDVQVYLRDGEMACDLKVKHIEIGIDLGLTAFGTLVAHDGKLYAVIDQIELDDSISGLVKLMAQKLLEQTIDQYSGEYGIPLPIKGYLFDSVELQRGLITLSGRVE